MGGRGGLHAIEEGEELLELLGAEIRRTNVGDVTQSGVDRGGEALAGIGEIEPPGSPVSGIGLAPDVSRRFELRNTSCRGALVDLRAAAELFLGDSRAHVNVAKEVVRAASDPEPPELVLHDPAHAAGDVADLFAERAVSGGAVLRLRFTAAISGGVAGGFGGITGCYGD